MSADTPISAAGNLTAESGPQTTNAVWLGAELPGIVRGSQFYAARNDPPGRPERLTDAGRAVVWRAELVGRFSDTRR